MFSKACEYGIRAAINIASSSLEGQRTSLKAIAKEVDAPEAFTAKILQKLSKAHLVTSIKGLHGGFEMNTEQLESVCLLDIVQAIDGNSLTQACGLGLSECNEHHPCPVHDRFKNIRNNLTLMLQETKITQLAIPLNHGIAFLKTN